MLRAFDRAGSQVEGRQEKRKQGNKEKRRSGSLFPFSPFSLSPFFPFSLFPLLILTLPAWLPLLLDPGLVNTRAGGDSPFLVQRVHQMAVALQSGHFPVRWMPDAAYGYGYPFWNYYAPLAFYAAAGLVLAGVGIVESIKLVQILGFLGAAVGMYRLAEEVLNSRPAALLAAAAYTYAPFHLVNLYVRGDSLGEFTAFAFYPLVLLSLHRLYRRPGPGGAALASLAYAGLILSHNISALIFTPFAIAYALVLPTATRSSERAHSAFHRLGWALAAFALGLALSAFYWAPALLEQGAVQLEENLTGFFHYAGHFRGANLVQRSLRFDFDVDAAGTPFAMGLVQAILGVAGLLALLLLAFRRPPLRRYATSLFFAATALIATFLITPWSRPLWDHLPLLPFVQFPWRWLSVQALAVAMLIGALACLPRWPGGRWAVAVALSVLSMATVLPGLRVEYLPLRDADVTPRRLMLYELFTGNIGSTVRAEYLPQAVRPRPWTSGAVMGRPEPPIGADEARLLSRGPVTQRWQVRVTTERELVFATYWFPGWRATVDGQPVPTVAQPGHGGIRVRIPAGTHEVTLALGRSPLRLAAELVSLLGSLALVGFALVAHKFVVTTSVVQGGTTTSRHLDKLDPAQARCTAEVGPTSPNPETLRVSATPSISHYALRLALESVAIAAIVLLLLTALRVRAGFLDGPLTMDFDRMPYLHPNPGGVRWEGGPVLRSYTLTPKELQPGQTLAIEMVWEGVEPGMEAELALVSPAEVLFDVPAILAVARTSLSSTTSVRLTIPEETNPGLYLLRLRVFGTETAPARSETGYSQVARSETGHSQVAWSETGYSQVVRSAVVYLEPLRVHGRPRPLTGEGIPFGDVALLGPVQVEQPSPERLQVRLIWQALRPLATNYATSLRLLDATGRRVAMADAQPCYGFCPTRLWQPGVAVYDRRWLTLPEGLAPGDDYRLEVVLYEVATLQPVGTARIDGVTLTQPTLRPDVPLQHRFNGLGIVGAELDRETAEPGERVLVQVRWWLREPVAQDHEVRLVLRGMAGGQVHAAQMPIAPGFGTSRWPRGAFVARPYPFRLPRDLPPGDYRIAIGLAGVEGLFDPGLTLRITPSTRVFEPPELARRLDVDFGGQIRLLGYTLEQDANALSLLVAWQALQDIEQNYKTFVHLFDPATERIVAQRDAEPRGGDRPTSTWIAGEVVTDGFHIMTVELPAGTYRLAIGLYDPVTGQRLRAVAPNGQRLAEDRVVLEPEVRLGE
jgi:hypothetical protein